MSELKIIEKSYQQADGTAIVAHMVRLGDQDYLTVAEAAEAFGVTAGNIRQIVIKHGLDCVSPTDAVTAEMKAAGVIGLRTSTVNLLPREAIDALVRIINTDEAKAAYRQILGEWREAKIDQATATSAVVLKGLKDIVSVLEVQQNAIAATEARLHTMQTLAEQQQQQAKEATDALRAELDAGPMTKDQMDEMQKWIWRCSGRVGCKPNWAAGQIKLRWLPKGQATGRTWKEVARRDVPEIMEFLKTYERRGW